MTAKAFVALGANVGDPAAQVLAAIAALGTLAGTRLVRHSSLYRTAPIGDAGQPDFINAVAEIETALAPHALLGALQGIERRFGRERPYAGAPRTLDLDLLLYGDETIDTPTLVVPHPRMHVRAFVLAPLDELDPDGTIQGRGRVADLLAACREQRVRRLVAG